MLRISGLSRQFGEKFAAKDINVDIPTGSFVGVIGRSGAGKSTLLRMINRLQEPSAGTILYDSPNVATLNVTQVKGAALRAWRRQCAMIFQQFNLVGRVDVLTNVLMGRLGHMPAWRAMFKIWSHEDRVIALAALEQMDIAGLATQRADRLSGGQQQRVAICRALVQEPDIILADEPIASLDPRNTKVVMDALQRINREFGITVIVNLHSLDLARSYCDRLIGMAQGRVVFDDVPEGLTEEVARELYGLEAGDVMAEAAPVRQAVSA